LNRGTSFVRKEYISMSNPSIDDVFKIDQLLHQLAFYEVTGGKIILPDSMEYAYEIQKKVAKKFNYFKTLIRSGECSIDFIKNRVLQENGPFPKEKPITVSDPEFMNKIMALDKDTLTEDKPDAAEFVESILKIFSSEMTKKERKDFFSRMGIKTFKAKLPLSLPEPIKNANRNKSKNGKRKKSKL